MLSFTELSNFSIPLKLLISNVGIIQLLFKDKFKSNLLSLLCCGIFKSIGAEKIASGG